MRDKQLVEAPETKPPEGEMSKMWAEAAKAFESICGESLQKGDVKNFDDVQRKIESSSKASYGLDVEQDDKWDKAKSVGLQSLKYLKMLVGAASQASSFVPIPASVANITSTALCFVFDIPEAIKGYNDAINLVFGEVSSALSQFQIYQSMDNVDPLLIRRIHQVMVSFVKLCAHVVKYRQGRKRDRLLRQIKSIFDDDSGLADEMKKFKQALQQQRDVEGTITLAVVVETRHEFAGLLERSIAFGKTTEETHRAVQEMQKGVQSLNEDADRIKMLIKIRDTLGVPSTVRLDTKTTQTCTSLARKCSDGTGSWIWTHDAYTTWTTPKDKDTSHVLLVALITKRLEEQKGRTYVAHYFFPTSTKKSDDEKNPVQSALKYMAFQIARVDATVQKTLGNVCDAGAFSSSTNLDNLWEGLKIGAPGSGATYYLVFDGLENLPDIQAEILLKFIFSPKLAEQRVRVLASGIDDKFPDEPGVRKSLRIHTDEHNGPDMRIIIDEVLKKEGMLQHAKPNSDQQRAKDKILEKLPQNVQGSYSQLQFGLDNVISLLSTRTAVKELDRMLDQSMSSHEVAIKNLQRSLTVDEISELNELLKWVLFSNEPMNLDQLEAAMFLYSGTESLASLKYIIQNKYSAVLKLEDQQVYGKAGVRDYLQKEKHTSSKSSQSKERPTISMTITINNVDQELCGHFLWDLAHKAIRDKFKFDFDATSNALHNSQAAIALDEFEAHHTIVTRAFEYLSKEHSDQTKEIGKYLVTWLPFHLDRLRQLEDEEKGTLMPDEQLEIGQNLYKLFQDEGVFRRHKAIFEGTWWVEEEIEYVQKWLMDSAVVRRLDKRWRDEVQLAVSPTRGYLRKLVRMVVEGFLRERSWGVQNAYFWIERFMEADDKKRQQPPNADASPSSPFVSDASGIDWDRVSAWCQSFLGLPDSELNSLWYERLAAAAFSRDSNPDTVLSLYQCALEKEKPSWLCHRGLGEAYFSQSQTPKAIAQVELALKEAEREGAMPKPERRDIVDLHLLLGRYTYEAGGVQKAAEHYLLGCKSEDEAQARESQLGHLKAVLNFPDMDETMELLKSTLADEKGRMVSILKMIAQDLDHDAIVSKMFTVAKGDLDLLNGIVHAMETATAIPVPSEDHTADNSITRFVEGETRGVLLYDRGVAAYTYKVSLKGTEPVSEALRLWRECCDQLSDVGGGNAFFVRQQATEALAKHYFQSMRDGQHLYHIDALSKLERGDSAGFLGALYALRGEKEQSKAVLVPQIKLALQILSDDIPENDSVGFSAIFRTLLKYLDFENAAVALSLFGQPDLVTEALYFEAKDIMDDEGVDKQQVLHMVTKLAKETVQVAKTEVSDASRQVQRIEAAKAHIDSLIAVPETSSQLEADVDHDARKSEGHGEGELPNSGTAIALRLLHSRLSALQQTHTPRINTMALQWSSNWACDGHTPDGKRCEHETNFEREFYHCIYCPNRDFCGDCLKHLRDPKSCEEITACSPKHRWLIIPPQGADLYVGFRAESVKVPRKVRAVEGDEMVLEICYAEDGGQEVMVEEWKEKLAREWGISLEEVKEMFRQTIPEDDVEDEKKEGEEGKSSQVDEE
ncbi:putative neutral amino acid permease protein [Mycena venus]|uniref:Putative neutral amino acid permease protein n=1 Tax=Mycena venus TaxID=2733690 RepID=A0A8H7DCT1_9AGAR|nr:putative neutral amino acid permease protein [Mycena venus]